MPRLRIFSSVLSVVLTARRVSPAAVSTVLTAMLIVAGVVFAATDPADPTAVELNPVVAPTNPANLHPVERVPREQFGLVGSFPLTEDDLKSLLYPSVTEDERAA